MELYAALDVALQKTAICVLDRDGRTVLETVVTSEPEALAACLTVRYSEAGIPSCSCLQSCRVCVDQVTRALVGSQR